MFVDLKHLALQSVRSMALVRVPPNANWFTEGLKLSVHAEIKLKVFKRCDIICNGYLLNGIRTGV